MRRYYLLNYADLDNIDREAREKLQRDGEIEVKRHTLTAYIVRKGGIFTALSVLERMCEYDVYQPILTAQLNYFMSY